MSLFDPTFNKELETLKNYAFIVVMGVSGTGKSTLGSALATALDLPYVEGDDLHPRSNIEKMSSGHPLTDSDREPWLKLIRTTAEHMALEVQSGAKVNTGGNKHGVVISCSALKRRYRDVLRGLGGQEENNVKLSTFKNFQPLEPLFSIMKTVFIHIEGTRDVLMDRMTKRIGHFMKPSMLDKQLEALENPVHEEGIIVVSMMDSTEDQVRVAQQGLKRVLNMEMEASADP